MIRTAIISITLLVILASGLATAATIEVTTSLDKIEIDDLCSLREAITAANLDMAVDTCAAGDSDADIITLPNTTFTIQIGGKNEDNNATGDFDILDGVTIRPAVIGNTATIDANGLDRVFEVHAGASLSLSTLTITGGVLDPGYGGCIRTEGDLVVARTTVTNCSAGHGGGIAVWNGGLLELTQSRVNLNSASSQGGGIYDGQGSEPCVITDSTISGNTTATSGGGISVRELQLSHSTVSGNSAGADGGGIYWPSDSAHLSTLVNSTISSNFAADNGGGLFCDGYGHTELSNVTITNNTADSDGDDDGAGGGVAVTGSVSLRLQNSIVAGNHDLSVGTDPELSPDCSGAVTSWGFNLFGIAESGVCTVAPTGGDLFGTPAAPIDPLLGALASNGGGTETHLPEMSSPVVDAGDPAGCTDQDGVALSNDQRGVTRHLDGLDPDHDATCDMGAVELENLIEIYNDDFEDGTTGGWSSAVGLVE